MQRTADLHHHVANAVFPQPDGLFEHTAAFDAAIDMVDAHAPPRALPTPRLTGPRRLMPARLLRRSDAVLPVQRECLKAQISQQLAPCRQWIGRGIGDALIMDTARMRLTEKQNAQGPIDQQEVFEHVPPFLAAIASFLFSRVVGARDGALGAIMTKRGAAGGGAVRPASVRAGSSGREGPSRATR